jgi:hypothetical protein
VYVFYCNVYLVRFHVLGVGLLMLHPVLLDGNLCWLPIFLIYFLFWLFGFFGLFWALQLFLSPPDARDVAFALRFGAAVWSAVGGVWRPHTGRLLCVCLFVCLFAALSTS